MTRKTFLLGAGGQKCGTSWLHDMLTRSPQVDMGFSKEYHIHDARTLPECARFKISPMTRYERLMAAGTPPPPGSKLALRAGFMIDPETYYDYFAQRVAAPGIVLTGDFTPSYSGLSIETLTEIRDGIAARGEKPPEELKESDPEQQDRRTNSN